nr:PREDICTED: uncharacterized protein LOC103281994 [Anolis carolinensis]|eukprot:XP_008122645.1 PREDICTED: uncharacterized protein LOC103281994 [Anolis carolinensis]
MVEISEPGSAQAGSRKRLHSQANMEEKKETDGEEGEESPGETRSPPEKQKSRARQLWRTLQKDFRHAVEKMKTEEMKVAYLSHGLQHLSHLVLDSPVRYVTHDPLEGSLHGPRLGGQAALPAGRRVLQGLRPGSLSHDGAPVRHGSGPVCGLGCRGAAGAERPAPAALAGVLSLPHPLRPLLPGAEPHRDGRRAEPDPLGLPLRPPQPPLPPLR